MWITVRPGEKVGRRVRVIETAPDGIAPLVTVTATTRSGRRSRLALRQRADGGWVVSGTLGDPCGATPAHRGRLRPQGRAERGVGRRVWTGPASSGTPKASPRRPRKRPSQILAEVASAPLDSLASEINRRSLNLGAELLLQWAGGRERGPERLTDHVRRLRAATGVYLVDGSGLSFDDRVTPPTFISYLAKFPATSAGRNFPQLLPANGTGTLRRLNSGFPGVGVVRAKTGTLGQVSPWSAISADPRARCWSR